MNFIKPRDWSFLKISSWVFLCSIFTVNSQAQLKTTKVEFEKAILDTIEIYSDEYPVSQLVEKFQFFYLWHRSGFVNLDIPIITAYFKVLLKNKDRQLLVLETQKIYNMFKCQNTNTNICLFVDSQWQYFKELWFFEESAGKLKNLELKISALECEGSLGPLVDIYKKEGAQKDILQTAKNLAKCLNDFSILNSFGI